MKEAKILQLSNTGEMNLKEAAAYCKLKPRSLTNRIYVNAGPRHMRRFGKLIFLSSDLDAWLQSITRVVKASRRA